MLLAWINRADQATLSASAEIATLPGENVQHPHVARAWHTPAGTTSAAITLDMGAAVACQLLALLGTNLTAAATVRLRASDADPAALATLLLDTGALAATAKTGYPQSYHDFAATTARHWRLDVSDASGIDHLEIGRLFLGPRWQPSVNQEFGWSVQTLDPSVVDESRGGQSIPDALPQRRQLQFSLNWMDEAEMVDNAFALARATGVVGDVLAVHNSLNGSRINEQSVFGLLTETQPLVHERSRTFRTRFTIKERL